MRAVAGGAHGGIVTARTCVQDEAKAKRKRDAQMVARERDARIAAGGEPPQRARSFAGTLLAGGRAQVNLGNDELVGHPLRRIQRLIAETHEKINKDVQDLMDKQERQLRDKIAGVLQSAEEAAKETETRGSAARGSSR